MVYYAHFNHPIFEEKSQEYDNAKLYQLQNHVQRINEFKRMNQEKTRWCFDSARCFQIVICVALFQACAQRCKAFNKNQQRRKSK